MKHLVIKLFECKESGDLILPGSFYVSNNYERVMKLEEMGFIKANEKVSTLKKETKTSTRTKKASE